MFIGRQDELRFLEEKYTCSGGQLVVLYGRRRIGKTETLRKFCVGKEHIFYTCTECPDAFQLAAFCERLLQSGFSGAKNTETFTGWAQALCSIAELPMRGKKLLVIDEFPYMVKGNASISSILQKTWDEVLRNNEVMIVLCGSAISFIENEVLAEKNPLYDRATGIHKMEEMTFYEAIQFLPNSNALDKISAYAVLGGIPHYLKQFDDSLPLSENIYRNILYRGSILYNEVEFLMHQELRETAVYNVIIEAIALGNARLSDIHQKTQIEETKLSAYIKNLIKHNIIRRESPIPLNTKEQANTQRAHYEVTDNYFRFWFAFVFPNISEIEAGDSRGIWEHIVNPSLDRYTSHIFEDICRQYLRELNRKNALPFYFTKIGRCCDTENEIDIVATDSTNSLLLHCECSYKNATVSLSELMALKSKFDYFDRQEQVFHGVFSKSGFSEGLISIAKAEAVILATAEDVVNLK